jgi:hypothetical protein
MLKPDDIQRLCRRKYPAFLKSVVTGERFFPLEIRFGRPSTTGEWETLQREISALANGNLGYRIEWAETNTRRWGRQKFPERVWFESEGPFLNALCEREEVEHFRANLALIREQCPKLEPWLPANAPRVAEFSTVWPNLLIVCRYFLSHPRPGLYARELPIEVDTKFIERHEGILRNLLDFLLPEAATKNADRFEERFGLRYDEPLIRFRLLHPELKRRLSLPVDDLAVPLSQFRSLFWKGLSVLITENKMRTTFLTLPALPNTLGIWGGGGAAELLASVNWLAECRLMYWGDIDVHGFHILSRLRQTFANLTSVMMDEKTLDGFSKFIVTANEASHENVSHLTADEHRAYQRVRAKKLLLEQEKIPHSYAAPLLASVAGQSP